MRAGGGESATDAATADATVAPAIAIMAMVPAIDSRSGARLLATMMPILSMRIGMKLVIRKWLLQTFNHK